MPAKRKPTGAVTISAPYICFMDNIPVDQAGPGDVVSFYNRHGKLCGNRIGIVVAQKRVPSDKLAVRMRKLGDKLGPVQIINRKDVLHAYRETMMEDPTEEVI